MTVEIDYIAPSFLYASPPSGWWTVTAFDADGRVLRWLLFPPSTSIWDALHSVSRCFGGR